MTLTEKIVASMEAATGEGFDVLGQQSMGGGCINSAWRLDTSQGSFFVKTNSAELLQMFEAEAEGLRELAAANAIRVPVPVCSGVAEGQAYLVMEYLRTGSRGSMAVFGEQLAQMHRHTSEQYGWRRDNTIGSTPQPNAWCADWQTFWRERRLGFQLQLAKRKGASRSLCDKGQQLLEGLDVFFSGYTPQASVLHGDLWSGNYAMTQDGQPVIFDPAVYFGDREADLAMTELFGGFSKDFYAAYNASWRIDPGYSLRKTLYNLYHILNHFNLFGGGYADQAERMIERLLSEVH